MMEYCDLQGEDIVPAQLTLPKAGEAFNVIISTDFFSFISAKRKENGNELLIFDVQVERGQRVINDIKYTERIAIEFYSGDNIIPFVFALRKDFPQVPHLNLQDFEIPKCLCLYEILYEELKLNWRTIEFLERIREWLRLTAIGKLHQDDQPLEPLLLEAAGTLVLPRNIQPGDNIYLYLASQQGAKLNLIGYPQKIDHRGESDFKLLYLKGDKAQTNGIINKTPRTLFELNQFLEKAGIDLVSELKKIISDNIDENQYNKKILIYIELPKKRTVDSSEIFYDKYACALLNSFLEVGKSLDLITVHNNIPVKNMNPSSSIEGLKEIKMDLLKPHIAFNKEYARLLNNVDDDLGNIKIIQVGVGALGSQIFMNLSRMGIGKWTLTDHDVLLPHNLARHSGLVAGLLKTESVSMLANGLLNDYTHSFPFFYNFFNALQDEVFTTKLSEADLILDVSTSIAVERKLANISGLKGRKVSLFLNPSGKDLVILSEGTSKHIGIDELEMQYYRVLLSEPDLKSHLSQEVGTIRYTNSCRDITSRISQDTIALQSAIASNAIKKLITASDPFIKISRVTDDDYNVNVKDYSWHPVKRISGGDWEIVIDDFLINKLNTHRISRLPNETGGILIGNVDYVNKKVYIVDSILSPIDSMEYPTAYYRGITGVTTELKMIEDITAGNLYYIGEWHSHPDKCSLEQSSDDKILFEWLTKHMASIGFPGLLMIFGENNSHKIHFKSL